MTCTPDGYVFRAFRPPGYPLVLASLLLVFGDSDTPPMVLNAICEILVLLLIMGVVLREKGAFWAIVAGLIYGGYVLWTCNAMTESISMLLYTFVIVACMYNVMASNRGAFLLGVCICMATFIRPLSGVFLVLCVVAVPPTSLTSIRSVAVRWGLLGGPLVVVVSLWTWRNYQLLGVPVPLSTNLGLHNSRDFGLDWGMFGELRAQGLNEAEINRRYMAMELQRVVEEPMWFLQLCVKRFFDLFTIQSSAELHRLRMYTFVDHRQLWDRVVEAVGVLTLPVYVLGGLGLCFHRRRRTRWIVAGTWLFLLTQCAVSRGDIRLLAPIFPCLVLMATFVVESAVSRVQRHPLLAA